MNFYAHCLICNKEYKTLKGWNKHKQSHGLEVKS